MRYARTDTIIPSWTTASSTVSRSDDDGRLRIVCGGESGSEVFPLPAAAHGRFGRRDSVHWGEVTRLDKVSQRIRRSHDEGKKIFIVPDADSDFSARRKEYDERQRILQLPVDGCFFTPNHCDPGRLENLLEAMAVPPHDVIYRCMDDYGELLRKESVDYVAPGRKGRVYAYCEAPGIETRDERRNYNDGAYWNLEAPALDPLKAFLRGVS